jgi:2,4-dienoyl-CoA reductase [(3E)-enoyl-CoA-producing], peroxisomal
MVHLGANACIVGRNVEKTEGMAKDLTTAREGGKVIGIGAVNVRDVNLLQKAVDQCVNELGAVDFLMYIPPSLLPPVFFLLALLADMKVQSWRSR